MKKKKDNFFGLFLCINSSQLPPRSTRLLNRSRLQQGTYDLNGAESPRSFENLNLLNYKSGSRLSPQYGRDSANGSPDDQLFMLDKTLRNSMIQDVQYCKQQLLQLRSILQEVSFRNFFVYFKGKNNQNWWYSTVPSLYVVFFLNYDFFNLFYVCFVPCLLYELAIYFLFKC